MHVLFDAKGIKSVSAALSHARIYACIDREEIVRLRGLFCLRRKARPTSVQCAVSKIGHRPTGTMPTGPCHQAPQKHPRQQNIPRTHFPPHVRYAGGGDGNFRAGGVWSGYRFRVGGGGVNQAVEKYPTGVFASVYVGVTPPFPALRALLQKAPVIGFWVKRF
jgi:hypothetical protein